MQLFVEAMCLLAPFQVKFFLNSFVHEEVCCNIGLLSLMHYQVDCLHKVIRLPLDFGESMISSSRISTALFWLYML